MRQLCFFFLTLVLVINMAPRTLIAPTCATDWLGSQFVRLYHQFTVNFTLLRVNYFLHYLLTFPFLFSFNKTLPKIILFYIKKFFSCAKVGFYQDVHFSSPCNCLYLIFFYLPYCNSFAKQASCSAIIDNKTVDSLYFSLLLPFH